MMTHCTTNAVALTKKNIPEMMIVIQAQFKEDG